MLSLISKTNKDGYYCPICGIKLLEDNHSFYCSIKRSHHGFTLYKGGMRGENHLYFFYFDLKKNDLFYIGIVDLEIKRLSASINQNIDSVRHKLLFGCCIDDFNFVDMDGVISTMDTYLLFS